MALNEATLASHMMQDLFIHGDIPEFDSPERTNIPCQILEFRSAFTSHDRFNVDLYTFVRGSKKERTPQPHESDLRSRSDLTFMVYMNAIRERLKTFAKDPLGSMMNTMLWHPFCLSSSRLAINRQE